MDADEGARLLAAGALDAASAAGENTKIAIRRVLPARLDEPEATEPFGS